MKTEKIRVAVLYGGRSAEHEVSVQSARNVMQYLDPNSFEIIPIGIDKKGNWCLGDEIFAKSLAEKKVPKLIDATQTWFTPEWIGKPVEQQQIKEVLTRPRNRPWFDVVFPVVHGTFCEDGSLQGLLELADIPYVGCGVLASAVNMDKDVAKRLATQAGIRVAPYVAIKQDQWQKNSQLFLEQIEKLGYPLFVKPANTGSSIGITKVKTKEKLTEAISEAFQFDTKILVEKGLTAYELEVAVLESLESTEEPFVSVVGEIKCRHEFYSYDAKYVDENGAELLIPASIADPCQIQARAVAKQLFQVLECESMARVDLFLCKESQYIYFNEINTIPGFTKISMYPKLMDASGLAYSDLLTHLVKLAIKRHKTKSKLKRSYEVEVAEAEF